MPRIEFEDEAVATREGETVLDALLRQGVAVPFSCKGGSCLTCLMQCTLGTVEASWQAGLSDDLQRKRYFLPCQCRPDGDMAVRGPQPADLLTPSYFCEATALDGGLVQLIIEPQRTLRYRTGQTVHVVSGEAVECVLTLTSDPDKDFVLIAQADAEQAALLPSWAQPGAEFGHEFELRGPFDERLPQELPYPSPDPELWVALDDGRLARQVFEAFYAKVYADEQLSPFFAKVTMARAIDKQFSFFKQCVTGEKSYMGDRPRNAHHWMIITHALFDHRQTLMRETLQEHGLSDALVARWQRFEEYFRPDMVKSTVWPKQVGEELVMQHGFSTEVLGEASLCDHCGAEIAAGQTVQLHQRLGTIACTTCAGTDAATDAIEASGA